MKQFLLFVVCLTLAISVKCQNTNRSINFNPIDKDSLNISLNTNFYLIEDSCAQIVRHTRFNFETRKFHGKFTDVSKADPNIIITEGVYNEDGLKEGTFILHYLNGGIRAKGNFRNNKFDGKWERFYENGKPEMIFEAKNDDYLVTDAWKPDGSKIVDNGNGQYVANIIVFSWKGKLVNGKPDGTWKMYDAKDNSVVATEHFKNGQFKDGENNLTSYSNATRISLVTTVDLPFINAESMRVGAPCNFKDGNGEKIIDAHYKAGINTFNIVLGRAITSYFRDYKIEAAGSFFIKGDITTRGNIDNLIREGVYETDIAQHIIEIIRSLPRLEPATIDGKPVVQKFQISLELQPGSYHYSFKFLPLHTQIQPNN